MTRVWTNDSNTHDLCTHSLSSRVDRKDHSPTLTNLLGWEIELYIWSDLSKPTLQTVVTLGMANQSWSRTKFGGHTYTLGAWSRQGLIKTWSKIAKIKPIGGQQVERTDFRSAFLENDVSFHWNWSHHIIIWVDEYSELVDMFVGCGGYPNPT